MQPIEPSRTAFAIVMIAIGIWCLAVRDFVAIWAPGIQPAALRPAIAITCALVSTAAGAGLLLTRRKQLAARMLLGFLILWTAWCKLPPLLHAPLAIVSWESLGETLVVTAAAWALAVSDRDGSEDGFTGRKGQGPSVLYGCALIAFGAAHFGYPAMTAALVPKWLPWPLGWVYFTGAAYIAAGAALVAGRFNRSAAILSALQMALFGLLVWLPRILEGALDADSLNEAAISFALAASGWVVAARVASAIDRTVEGTQHPLGRFVLIGKSRVPR